MKQEKYYLVPKENDVLYRGLSLIEILKQRYPKLYQMEDERIDILYSTNPNNDMSQFQKARYKKHLEKTKIMYEKLMIPQYLIVCGNDKKVKEVLTKQQLFSMYSSALGIREVSKEKAEDYFNTSNYSKK